MKINLTGLNNAIASALAETNQELARSAQRNLRAKRWNWDRVTRRRSGQIVFTPRDIVDTGQLSRSMKFRSDGRRAFVRYDARHASIVHRRRPWLRTTLNEVDVLNIFANNLRDKL
ncbi:MAG: hypothetical protein ACRC62_13100 [Microcoleus sp.]